MRQLLRKGFGNVPLRVGSDGQYKCSPCHQTYVEPSLPELKYILSRGEHSACRVIKHIQTLVT